MKKTFICLILIFSILSSMLVFATTNLDGPTPTPESTQTTAPTETTPASTSEVTPTNTTSPTSTPTDTPSNSPTTSPDDDDDVVGPTATAEPTPTAKPSVNAPFEFSATTYDGKTEIIQGEVDNLKLTFKIMPNGTEPFKIKKITNKDTGYEISTDVIEISKNGPGWSDIFDVGFNPTDVDKSVVFELLWEDFSGNERTQHALFKVNVAVPQLTVTATLVDAVVPGAPISIKYHIQNTGNVKLSSVELQDLGALALNKDIVFNTEESLEPGSIIERDATISLDGEATLTPTVSFTYKDQVYTVKGTDLVLSAQDVIPTITLTCDNFVASYKGAEHLFKYTIVNTTQVELTEIYVYDSDGSDAGIVYGPFSLAAGETYSGTYKIPVYKSGYYKFKIHYSYEGAEAEKQQSAKTDQPLRLPNEVFIDILQMSPSEITGPGEVVFTLLIENGTADDLRNVAIEEENNLFERIELNQSIPAATSSGATKFQHIVKVNIPAEADVIQFNLHYTVNGELSIINTSYDVNFTEIATPTPSPTVTASPVPTTAPPKDDDDDKKDYSNLILWLIIFLLTFVLVLIIVILIAKNRNKKDTETISVKRKVNTAFDDDFDYDDYTDLDDSELDALLDEAEQDKNEVITVVPDIVEDDDEDLSGGVDAVTAAILSTSDTLPEDSEEFKTEFDDEIDDEGVKIFKSKK